MRDRFVQPPVRSSRWYGKPPPAERAVARPRGLRYLVAAVATAWGGCRHCGKWDEPSAPSQSEERRLVYENRVFWRRWLRDPFGVGALGPSSAGLAAAMADCAAIDGGEFIELGGGTGAVTAALLRSGLEPERLTVVERDPRLHRHLQARFPRVRAVLGDARDLCGIVDREAVPPAAAIVSSLPLLAMPWQMRRDILDAAFANLRSSGCFVQFTYGPGAPVPDPVRRALRLRGERTARVWRNLPPATVWRYARAEPLEAPA